MPFLFLSRPRLFGALALAFSVVTAPFATGVLLYLSAMAGGLGVCLLAATPRLQEGWQLIGWGMKQRWRQVRGWVRHR